MTYTNVQNVEICKIDDEKICMSDPEHDCQHCSIFIGKIEDTAEDIYG